MEKLTIGLRSLAAAVVVATLIYVIGNRYTFSNHGQHPYVYKMDKLTGRVWLVDEGNELLVKPKQSP
jgi:hypothetical protein